MKKKSSVSIVTGSLIIALALAGCGSSNQANSTEQNKATEKPTDKATDKETDKKVTIEYWQYEFPAKVDQRTHKRIPNLTSEYYRKTNQLPL